MIDQVENNPRLTLEFENSEETRQPCQAPLKSMLSKTELDSIRLIVVVL